MAANATISIPAATWTLLTDGNVTAARVQNVGAWYLLVKATVGAVAPSTDAGAIVLDAGEGFAADLTLAQLLPGVSGANRLYGYCVKECKASVSHA